MNRNKGHQRGKSLKHRAQDKRGGNSAAELPTGPPGSLAHEAARYLEALAVKNHTPDTIEGRRDALKVFLLWTGERDLTNPAAITKPILESYQRHLWRWRKKNGKPLGISTQRGRLGTLKDFFSWLAKQNAIPANPASELELPRPEKRLPKE
ncbi:MAG: site-specific integrase, partial [Verrucomicrobiae bacterium]|nr:site-specific integrase [Verrucomicrobiae bacterium]